MSTLVIREWDNPKEETRLKKYYQFVETFGPYLQKKLEEDVIIRMSWWGNGTGHMVAIIEEDITKSWTDEEYQREWIKFNRRVDNMSCRFLRQAISEPPK